MLIGYTGTLRKGYNVKELVALIGEILDKPEGQKVAIVGAGNLGRALMKYFSNRREKLNIVAAFDVNSEKVGTSYAGVKVYAVEQLKETITNLGITIGIISVPVSEAATVANLLVESGIKGILNYSPRPVNVPENIYLEEYDMITSLEKVAYFAKNKK